MTRRASGYGWRVEKSVAGRNVATVSLPASASTSSSVEVRAVVGRRAAELDGELHAGSGPELVGVEAQAEPGRPSGLEHRPALVGVECARSQKASTHRACGAQAVSISPHTRST